MSKLVILFLATCVAISRAMKGGKENYETVFSYFVFFITGDKNVALLELNDTTPTPDTKWRYCMGILYDVDTVVTAELCKVQTGPLSWVAGWEMDPPNFHTVRSVVSGRHVMDFSIVNVSSASIETWKPLGDIIPSLMVPVDEDELSSFASKQTAGVVATFSAPPKIGAMTMVSLSECKSKYRQLVGANSSTFAVPPELPSSVFCAVQAKEAFDPKIKIGNTTNTDGAIPPGTPCTGSLGSPFIISGGYVLGILVAADCRSQMVSFFQSLAANFPLAGDIDALESNWSRLTSTEPAVPGIPMILGETIRPLNMRAETTTEAADAEIITPSMLTGLMLTLWTIFN